MRKEYLMTDKQYEKFLSMLDPGKGDVSVKAYKKAWSYLAKELDFDSDSVQPVRGKDGKSFTAI